MATVNEAEIDLGNLRDAEAYIWETLTATNNDGRGVNVASYPHKSVQLIGTFDSATVVIQGTIDGTNWFTLQDPAGDDLSFTDAGGRMIGNHVVAVRPLASGGGGSQDVDVLLMAMNPYSCR